MIGIPQTFGSAQDWKNVHAYALTQDAQTRLLFVERLEQLKATKTCLTLKKGVKKSPEELSSADFEATEDPSGALAQSGLSVADVDAMINGLKA